MVRHLRLFLILSLATLAAPLYAQTASDVQSKIDQANRMVLSGNFSGARSLAEGILAKEPQNGPANFVMGLAILGEDPKRDNRPVAGEYFVKAAQAGYHQPFGSWEKCPVNENSYIDANWQPAEDILKEKDPQKQNTAINLLENIVTVKHKEHDASEHLGKLFIQTGQSRRAMELFQRLLEASPGESESIYTMGLGFFDIYNREMAESILADLSSEGPENLTSLMKLLMARAFFVLGDNRIASVYYFQAMDDLNEISAREIYRDNIDIILDKEKSEYEHCRTVDQKKAFFRKFWKSRDPSPTTEYNERLVEHYRRLNYAKQNYYIRQTKGYDDRGRIYIKHGEPDQKAVLSGNFGIRDSESWLYRRKPDDFIFHFVKRTGSYLIVPRLADAVIGSSYAEDYTTMPDQENPDQSNLVSAAGLNSNFRELLLNRAEIAPLYFQMATERADFNDPEYVMREMETNYAMEENKIIMPALTVGENTETYKPDMGAQPLDYYYYTADFMAMNANSNVNIFYGLPISSLDFKRDILGVRVNYESTFAVFDQEWNEVKRVYNQRSYQLKQEPDRNNKGLLLVDKQTLNLPPGQYHYSVSVRDLGSNHLGIYKGELEVTHYKPDDFNVSQVVMASSVTQHEGARPGKFTRGRLDVMPLPSRAFLGNQPAFVYYEIYNLTKGTDGKKHYKVDFSIEADKLDRNIASKIVSSFGGLISKKEDKGKITLTFDKEGDAESVVEAEYVSIDIADSPAGHYNLNIVVTDAVSGKTITRSNEFNITKPEKKK